MTKDNSFDQSDHLFVYGTLRRSITPTKDIRQMLDHEAELLGNATVMGRLYNIGRYPGLILSDNPNEIVMGELYKIKDKRVVLHSLDQYEGSVEPFPKPWEYQRVTSEVTMMDGRSKVISWLYTYQWDVNEEMRIPFKDYLEFLSQS